MKNYSHLFFLRPIFLGICGIIIPLFANTVAAAETNIFREMLDQAQKAYAAGNPIVGIQTANKVIEAAPEYARAYFVRGKMYEMTFNHEKAIADYTKLLSLDPKAADIYEARGEENFRAGHVTESVADFDKFLEFAPGQRPLHWQRGISLYYAGRYDDGRKQFELHQTVNPNDVENAVWHYLCVAKLSGVEKARAGLLPIHDDQRVVMMDIYGLYKGAKKPEEVLAAANAKDSSPTDLKVQLFYAYLYLGLYFEANGDSSRAKEFIKLAASQSDPRNYMGDVAKVHAVLLDQKDKAATPPAKTESTAAPPEAKKP